MLGGDRPEGVESFLLSGDFTIVGSLGVPPKCLRGMKKACMIFSRLVYSELIMDP